MRRIILYSTKIYANDFPRMKKAEKEVSRELFQLFLFHRLSKFRFPIKKIRLNMNKYPLTAVI